MLGIEDFINKFIKIKVIFEFVFRIKNEFNSPGVLKANEHNIGEWNLKKPEIEKYCQGWDVYLQ